MLSVIFVSSSSCSFDEQAKKFVAFLRSQRRNESDRRVKIDERNDVKSLEVGWLVTGSRPVKIPYLGHWRDGRENALSHLHT